MTSNSAFSHRSRNANEVIPFDSDTSFVKLQTGALVRVDNASLLDLDERGLTGRWYSFANTSGRTYVAMWLPASAGHKGVTTLATLITRRRPDESVRYANRDRFDLRRCNLIVQSKGMGREKDLAAHASAMFPTDPVRRSEWLVAEVERRSAQSRAARRARAVNAVGAAHAGTAGLTAAA